ncbi:hypothetical protein F4781DRAFT_431702 [Annulohypoxylon bovei var. microspora]|nr:hypothetical protein F4781DRAFT_431702 [Annulohypoxylon bovei var. microspora]
MNRPEPYNPMVTTPLLIDLHRAPTAPTAPTAPIAGTDTNGSAINTFTNGPSRTKGNISSPPKPASLVDKIAIHSKEYVGPCLINGRNRRKWIVVVVVNGQSERTTNLVDPFTEEEYYKNVNNRLQRGNLELNQDSTKRYFEELFDQLGLRCCRKKDCRISVHEDVTQISETSDFASIHSLLWEVLEHPDFWPCSESGETPVKRVRLSRTLNVLSKGLTTAIDNRVSSLIATQAEYRVLLVIARSFKKDVDQRYVDYRPSLIQGPLLNIARRTKERGITPKLHIDVVRPGTVEELDEYLKPDCEKPYDIVHFDLHGKIGPVKPPTRSWVGGRSKSPAPDDYTPPERQSYLRFARPYDPKLASFGRRDNAIEMLLHDDASLHDVPVKEIAEKLQNCHVSKVALNACLSSYAQSQIFLNMCHTFISSGVVHVSAMSFQILESTAEVYYSAFYESLILRGEEFHVAAASGREALRANNTPYGHAVLPTNYHRYPRSFSNEWWRSPQGKSNRLPLLALYFARYGVIFLLLTLCLTYLWLEPSFLSMLLPIASVFAMVIWMLTRRWLTRLTPVMGRKDEPYSEKSAYGSNFEIDIEHLVIEDRLKSEANQGALYVWSSQYSKELSDCVHDLAKTWVLTGFVDEVDIISASVFSWTLTSLFPWRWLRTRRYRSNRIGTVGRRRLLVIKNFDRFYPKHARDEDLDDLHVALRRMVSFIEGYDRDDTYLLITGSYDEEWWIDGNRYNDERIVETIVRAVPHNHNITPPRKHIPRWSMKAMRRRWSRLWNEMI